MSKIDDTIKHDLFEHLLDSSSEGRKSARLKDKRRVQSQIVRHTRKSQYILYIIGNGQGWFKIGKTTDMAARLRVLQSAQPYPLTVYIEHQCGGRRELASLESDLHWKYRRKRGAGEWFRLEESDINHLIETLS